MNTFSQPALVIVSLILGLGSALHAAPASTPATAPAAAETPAADSVARARQDHALIGREVFGTNNKKAGQLDDFVIASDSGDILYALVSTAAGLRAVPFSVLTPEQTQGVPMRLRLATTDEAWNDVPRFEKRQLDQLRAGTPQQQDLYRHFSLQPITAYPGEQQRLSLASEIVGKPLHRAGQVIGRVEDILVHFESRIATVLLAPSEKTSDAAIAQKYILPFSGVAPSSATELTTTLTPRQFTAVQSPATPEQAMTAPTAGSPYQWSAYGASATLLAPTPPPFQGRDLSASRPPLQAIREALASDPNTRMATVNVLAGSDRVILRGYVQDEDDKRRVEARVGQVAGGWMIDNQLRIASAGGE